MFPKDISPSPSVPQSRGFVNLEMLARLETHGSKVGAPFAEEAGHSS